MNPYCSQAKRPEFCKSQPMAKAISKKEFNINDCYFQTIKETSRPLDPAHQGDEVKMAATLTLFKIIPVVQSNISLSMPASPPLSCSLSPIPQTSQNNPNPLLLQASSLQSLSLSSSTSSCSSSSSSSLTTMSSSNTTTTSSFVMASTSFKSSSTAENSNEVGHLPLKSTEFDYVDKSEVDSTRNNCKELYLSYSAYLDSLRNKYKLKKAADESIKPSPSFNKSVSYYLSQYNNKERQFASKSLLRPPHRQRPDCTQQPGLFESSDFIAHRKQPATYTSTTTRLFPKSNSLFVPYKTLDSLNERLVHSSLNRVINTDEDESDSELTSVYLQTIRASTDRQPSFAAVTVPPPPPPPPPPLQNHHHHHHHHHSPHRFNESFFEQFIDSLDEINSYLESKLKRPDHSYDSRCQSDNDEPVVASARDSISSSARTGAPLNTIKKSETFHHLKDSSANSSNSRISPPKPRRSSKRYLTQPINLESAITYTDSARDDDQVKPRLTELRTETLINSLDLDDIKSTKKPNSIPISNTFSHELSLDPAKRRLQSIMNQNATATTTTTTTTTTTKTTTNSKKSDMKNAKNFVSLSDILNKTIGRNDSFRANASTLRHEEKKTEAAPIVAEAEAVVVQPAPDPTKPLVFDFLTVQALFKELELDCDEQIKKLDENEKRRQQIAIKQKKILDEIRLKWVQSPDSYKLAKSVRSISCSCFSRRRGGRRKRLRRFQSQERKRFKFLNSKLCVCNRRLFGAKESRKIAHILVRSQSLTVVKCQRRRLGEPTRTVFALKQRKGCWLRSIGSSELSKIFRNKSIDELRLQGLKAQLRPKKSTAKAIRPSTRSLTAQLPVIKMNSEHSSTSDDSSPSKSLLDKLYEKYCDQTATKSDEGLGFKELPSLSLVGEESRTSASSPSSPPPSTLLIRRKTKKYNGNLTFPSVGKINPEDSQNALLIAKQSDEMKNLEFLNLIEACKWLIEAGYSTLVHSFLKSQHSKPKEDGTSSSISSCQLVDNKNATTTTTHETMDNRCSLLESFDNIKEAYPQLQEHDLSAIYRRLEILDRSSASFIELDYDYLKDNYLNNQTEEEEEYCDDEDEEAYNEYYNEQNELVSTSKTSRARSRTPSTHAKMKIDQKAESPSAGFQKIQPVPTNNYYCIQFPLKKTTTTTPADGLAFRPFVEPGKPTTNVQLNSAIAENAKKITNLSRFHSFRLSDKISSKCKAIQAESAHHEDTKSYLDLAKSGETGVAPTKTVKTNENNFNPEKLYLYAIRNYNSQRTTTAQQQDTKPAEKYAGLKTPEETKKFSAKLDVDVNTSTSSNASSYEDETTNNTTTPLSYSPMSSSPPSSPQMSYSTTTATESTVKKAPNVAAVLASERSPPENRRKPRRATVVISFKNPSRDKTVELAERPAEKQPLPLPQREVKNEPPTPVATTTTTTTKPRHVGSITTTLNSSAFITTSRNTVKSGLRDWEEQLPKIELSASTRPTESEQAPPSLTTTTEGNRKLNRLTEELESFKLKSKNLKLADLTHDFNTSLPKSPKSANSLSTPTSSTSSGSSPGSALFNLSLSPTSASQFEYSSPYINTKYNDVKSSAGLISEHKKPRKFNTVGSNLIQKPIRNQMFQMSSSPTHDTTTTTTTTAKDGVVKLVNVDELTSCSNAKLLNSFDSLTDLNSGNELSNSEKDKSKGESPNRSEDFACNHQHLVDLNNNARRERRDSGMGGSLTRGLGRRRNREKWSSFVRTHRSSFKSSKLQLNSISVRQFSKLKKFAHVRITGLMEKYSPNCQKSGWNRFKTVPRFIKRHQKSADLSLYKNKQVFGVPLKVNFQRHGQPLPQPIIQIMRYLRKNASNTVGIFRKSGSKIRMSVLRETIERTNSCDLGEMEKKLSSVNSSSISNSSSNNLIITNTSTDLSSIGSGFSSQSTSKSDLIDELNMAEKASVNCEAMAIDVANILKQYFRELPECLFTNKISQMLIDIFTFFPENERLEAVQYCMMLIDDENRDVLQCLLYLLHDIAQCHAAHKMDVRNIAICLAPTLLNMNNLKELGATSHVASSASASPTSPISKDTAALMSRQCNASLDCLTMMIENPKKIFQIPNESFTKCQFTKMDYTTSLTLAELLGSYSLDVLNIYVDDRINEMLRELKEKPRSWTRLRNDTSVEMHYKDLENDEHELRLWKLTLELDASPAEVVDKLVKCRSQWDDDLAEARVVEALDSQTDIYQYVMHVMAPQPSRDFCELRAWREGYHFNSKPVHVFFSASIEHEKAKLLGDIRANTLRNFYMIESISETKCKLHQLYRADYRGYSTEWYNKVQGHLIKRQLVNLRECFKVKNRH